MLSVIIPTHDPRYLRETIGSVLAQTCGDFEIVVLPNGGARLEGALPEDPRIRVVPYDGPRAVGAIKRYGFGAARGDILVELDHDDLLAPTALERIREAAARGAGFVYSNFAEFREDGTCVEYNDYWGWRKRPAEVLGRPVTEMISFDPSPASIAYIWYAPHHVRAWTRESYDKAGGHDPSMEICDDHDLLARTYLSTKMVRIDECLYLRREHPRATYLLRNADIQKKTRELYAKYVERLVLHGAALRGLPCFDLGSSYNPAVGLAVVEVDGARIEADLRGRWPWRDGSIGAFKANDFLEHLPDKTWTMSEIHRCLAPGGWLLSSTPSALGQGAFMDPTHVSYWVRNSFLYYTERKYADLIQNRTIRFQEQRREEVFPTDWHRAENIPYLFFDGVALKEGYSGPGPHAI